MEQTELSLATLCDGELERDFKAILTRMVSALKNEEKGTIGISINIARVPDTTTMVLAKYSLKFTMPAVSRSSICQVGEGGNLLTDKPKPKAELNNLTLFPIKNAEVINND